MVIFWSRYDLLVGIPDYQHIYVYCSVGMVEVCFELIKVIRSSIIEPEHWKLLSPHLHNLVWSAANLGFETQTNEEGFLTLAYDIQLAEIGLNHSHLDFKNIKVGKVDKTRNIRSIKKFHFCG